MDAAILTTLVMLGGTIFICAQLHRMSITARGRLVLELHRACLEHHAADLKLRPGGAWSKGVGAPVTTEEWAELESYLQFFQQCELQLKSGALEMKAFEALFGYRVENIMANDAIVNAKLFEEAAAWAEFRDLIGRLGIPLPTGDG